jgi:hypothetical protein
VKRGLNNFKLLIATILKGGKNSEMSILTTAIAAGHWDLAAHALLLATIKTLNGEMEDAGKNNPQKEDIQPQ